MYGIQSFFSIFQKSWLQLTFKAMHKNQSKVNKLKISTIMFNTLMRRASKAETDAVKVYESKFRRFIHRILKLPFSSDIYYV